MYDNSSPGVTVSPAHDVRTGRNMGDWIGRHIVHIPENRCDPLCCFALGAIQLSDDTAPPRSAPTKYYNNELYASN